MEDLKISKTCQDNINKLNNIVQQAQTALQRATVAEGLLEKVKITAAQEIKNAYEQGYKDAKQDVDSSGGSNNDDDDKKLELKD